MKKSPFSTPRGNGGRPGFGWNSGGSPGGGYGRPKNNEFFSPNRNQVSPQNQSGSDDFIPFNNCTPPPSANNQRNSGGNWQSPRGHWQGNSGGGRGGRRHSASPGYNNYRDNNRGRDHHQQAPFYVDTGKPFYGQRRNFQRGRGGSQGKADVSRYVNLHSFLEDPWAELTKKLNRFDAPQADSQNDASTDLSFNSVLGGVCLDDSVNSMTSREAVSAEDSKKESHNSLVQASQEIGEVSACPDVSKDSTPSQDSKD